MHKVAILALDDFVALDLAIPCELFGRVLTGDGESAYDVVVCGERNRAGTEAYSISVSHRLEAIKQANTVIIPGVRNPMECPSKQVLTAIRAAWSNGARIASICTGAFVLAATGLLDGLSATTHWLAAQDFTERFPRVALNPKVLFVDEGQIITSAGVLAGVDMCLHLIARDYGHAVAAHAARMAVAPLYRDGGQAQFIRHELPESHNTLAPLLDWMQANLDQPLGVEMLAMKTCMSQRTFARRFLDQTGTTPLQWILKARMRHAQEMLERTVYSVDEIAAAIGFEATASFRTRFQKIVGVSPAKYRQRFSLAAMVE